MDRTKRNCYGVPPRSPDLAPSRLLTLGNFKEHGVRHKTTNTGGTERSVWKINILNSCPTQGRVEGWDAMKPLYYRSVSSKGAGRPWLTHHHKGWWNGTKWMRWVWRNGGMKIFVVGENGGNPAKNLPRPRFVHHETHMEGPRSELGTPALGGERLTACATRPPSVWTWHQWYSIRNNADGMSLYSTSLLGVYCGRRCTFWTCTGLRKFKE